MTDRTFTDAEMAAAWPHIRRFALSLTRNHAEAEDLTSATIIRALEGQANFEPGTSLKSWLFTIMRHRFFDDRRRGKNRPMVGVEDIELPTPATQGDGIYLREICRVIDTLPGPMQEALALVALENLSYEDAAAAAGVEIGTMRSRLSRARSSIEAAIA